MEWMNKRMNNAMNEQGWIMQWMYERINNEITEWKDE